MPLTSCGFQIVMSMQQLAVGHAVELVILTTRVEQLASRVTRSAGVVLLFSFKIPPFSARVIRGSVSDLINVVYYL